jgi:hypothetical protein
MLAKREVVHEILTPVAIYEKDLPSASPFTIQTYELCTICGGDSELAIMENVGTMNEVMPKWMNYQEGSRKSSQKIIGTIGRTKSTSILIFFDVAGHEVKSGLVGFCFPDPLLVSYRHIT